MLASSECILANSIHVQGRDTSWWWHHVCVSGLWSTGANCENAVECCVDRAPDDPMDVMCGCGATFCFNCKEEAHRPVSLGGPEQHHGNGPEQHQGDSLMSVAGLPALVECSQTKQNMLLFGMATAQAGCRRSSHLWEKQLPRLVILHQPWHLLGRSLQGAYQAEPNFHHV